VIQQLLQFLHDQPFFAIFGVVAVGMAGGRIKFGGLSFGSVICIILAGLGVSLLASSYGIALTVPSLVQTIFFNLFIFAIALRIGPQFFSGLQRDGARMATVGVIVALLAPLLSYACGVLFDLPRGSVAGLLAGANNSSASFGAANAALASGSARLDAGASIDRVVATLSASFALSYLVAEVAFVLFMKFLPTLARIDAPAAERAFEAEMRQLHPVPLPGTPEAGEIEDASVAVRAFQVTADEAVGMTLGAIHRHAPRTEIARIRRGGDWLELADDTALAANDEIVVVGRLKALVRVRELIGPELADDAARNLLTLHTVDVVVGKKEASGRTLEELKGLVGPGVYLVTVFRAGQELPVAAHTELQQSDVIRVTATEPHLAELETHVGHVVRASHVSDILWFSVGLLIGAALGAIPVPLFGVRVPFGAAAILVTGIVISWLKTRYPAGGSISEGGRQLLEDLGLNVFTAVLGLNAGDTLLQVLEGGSLWALVLSCLIVTLVPSIVAFWIGLRGLRLNAAVLLGAVAGARQCTASLKVAQELSGGSAPAIGYPVPLAIATVALSIEGYLFALLL
jgi:putative transport protein